MDSLKKITRKVQFEGQTLNFEKQIQGISLYLNEEYNSCVIVDNNDNVLFEINAAVDCRHAVLECV